MDQVRFAYPYPLGCLEKFVDMPFFLWIAGELVCEVGDGLS
jgi:hypothetical protein